MALPKPLDISVPRGLQTDPQTTEFYAKLVRSATALKDIETLATDGVTASVGYVQAEAQATMDKIDEILTAIKGV